MSEPTEQPLSNKDMFKEMTTLWGLIKNYLTQREEPVDNLTTFSQHLERIVEDPSILSEDEDFKKYFVTEMSKDLLKKLSKDRTDTGSVSV